MRTTTASVSTAATRWVCCLLLATASLPAIHAQTLPADVKAALAQAKVPEEALSALVVEVRTNSSPRLNHRSTTPMNPASVMKLVTTYAGLELLSPAYTWRTPVFIEGAVRDGTLYGKLYIQGQGDPKLVTERIWLLLRRIQGMGIQTIQGDIVLDHSAFDLPAIDPASFDGEPLRPQNVVPDALLLNYKSVTMTFTPDRSAQVARVQFDPPLAGVQLQAQVPLQAGSACDDYRATLKADIASPHAIRFLGSYPNSCGEKTWSVAYADPSSYAPRAIQGLWHTMGGKLQGSVRSGTVPAHLAHHAPAFELVSPPLSDVIRDINKFSNNVMAQQLYLTLGRVKDNSSEVQTGKRASFTEAHATVQRWWANRFSSVDAPVLDNGSGLSRQERISPWALARMLQHAYRSPLMPDLMASLPINGVDGTLRRVKDRAGVGSAHLKTGSLKDVVALAGYVHAHSGKRYVLVAIINHPNANAARPALQALTDWAVKDGTSP